MKKNLLRRRPRQSNDDGDIKTTNSNDHNDDVNRKFPSYLLSLSPTKRGGATTTMMEDVYICCRWIVRWAFIFCFVTLSYQAIWLILFPDYSSLLKDAISSVQGQQSGTQYPSFRRVPVMLQYDSMENIVTDEWKTMQSKRIKIMEPPDEAVGLHDIIKTVNEKDDPSDGDTTCQPMHKWQTENYPQCIRMHEVDMMPHPGSLIFINCGGDRCAWILVDETDGNKLILKTQKFRRGVYPETFEHARKDGLVMERLTKSQFVASTYGYCGLSQLAEYSQGGNIHDLVKTTRLRKKDLQTPLERFKVGIQVANAVADLHTFENDNVASVTHNDLCCHQFLLFDGIYKLNDFHMAKFLEKNKKNHETCKESASFASRYALLHAPEESNVRHVSNEKADVFAMGNVMYYVLTKKWLFEIGGESVGVALQKLFDGERSPFPENLQNSKDPADKALIEGIELAWIHDPSKRPKAREIADIMIGQLEKMEGRKYAGPDSIRVSIPPLPEYYRYSDSDFEANLG